MTDEKLIRELIEAAYNSGYYSGKHEDGQSHHTAAIKEREQLRAATLKRLDDLRAALAALVAAVEACETYGDFSLLIGKTVQQARRVLEEIGEAGDG